MEAGEYPVAEPKEAGWIEKPNYSDPFCSSGFRCAASGLRCSVPSVQRRGAQNNLALQKRTAGEACFSRLAFVPGGLQRHDGNLT